jgi:hypothetical protein
MNPNIRKSMEGKSITAALSGSRPETLAFWLSIATGVAKAG